MKVFISYENRHDESIMKLVEALRQLGAEVQFSPFAHPTDPDPRWDNWLGKGLKEALEWAEYFVAVLSAGYRSKTFAHTEFADALTRFKEYGKPRLFLLRQGDKQLPIGWQGYETNCTMLPVSPVAAAQTLQALYVASKQIVQRAKM